jgi:hypothetical protein
MGEDRRREFLTEGDRDGGNLLAEFWAFLRESKKWWMLPILVVLLLFGVLILLSGTAVAPFIYTLF